MSVVAKVPSLTRKGVTYDIEKRGDTFYCDCPAASFRKVGSPACKHVKIIETAAAASAACHRLHHGYGGPICAQCLINLLATLAAEVEKTKRKQRKQR